MNTLKRTAICVLAVIMVFAFSACGNDRNEESGAQSAETVVIAGSSAAMDLVRELSDEFKKENGESYANLQFEFIEEDSETAFDAVRGKRADIGLISREATSEEKGFVDDVRVFAADGIAAVVHKDRKLEDISSDDLERIFSGEAADWKDVNDDEGEIHVLTREETSGTGKEFFRNIFSDDEKKVTDKAVYYKSDDEIKEAVAKDINAIGYVSVKALDDTVKAISIDGAKASMEDMEGGKYTVVRNFSFVMDRESEAAADFADWVCGKTGQEMVKKAGYIPAG